MSWAEKYISYVKLQKRYSDRTVSIYSDVLRRFGEYAANQTDPDGKTRPQDAQATPPDALIACLSPTFVRSYQVHLLEECRLSARTVNLHLSVLSGYCRFLVKNCVLKSNPVSLTVRPRQPRRLPSFYKSEAMRKYLDGDNALRRRDFDLDLRTEAERRDTYRLCLDRIIVCLLYSTGVRRAELIGLNLGDVDFSRKVLRVRGKGDKTREIPIILSLIEEIELYLQSVDTLIGQQRRTASSPLLVSFSGNRLYPVLVDRAVKSELGSSQQDFTGRKSPHVLRHTLATGLLEEGADLNSIKEVLGHANLAATQVYTHSSAGQLKKIYEQAHPRAKAGGKANKNGGNNGN